MNWIFARLEEPSTWASLAGLVASLSFIPNAASWAGAIPAIGAAVAAVLGVVLKEKKA